MGKSNGRIQDWVKGGSGLRVTNGAAHVRIVGGGGGGSVTFPITPAQGGTGTTTVFTAGSVVFAGASGVYAEDNANLFWDSTNKLVFVGGASGGARLGNFSFVSGYSALWLGGRSGATDYTIVSAAGVNTYYNALSGTNTVFQVGGTEFARMTSAGRWLLGTTTDDGSSRLQVSGNLAVAGKVTSVGAGGDYIELDSSTNSITIFDNGVESGTIGVAGSVITFNRLIRASAISDASRVAIWNSNKDLISGPATAVTGSRAGNAALADLLTKLATIGVITDSTSA